MKVVVLAGGISTERDVSLSSGMMIYHALKESGHQVVLLDVYLGYEGDQKEIFERGMNLRRREGGGSRPGGREEAAAGGVEGIFRPWSAGDLRERGLCVSRFAWGKRGGRQNTGLL